MEGSGVNEIGKDARSGKVLVKVNPKFFRPADVELLVADSSKARRELGWKPKTSFEKLVEIMVKHDRGD